MPSFHTLCFTLICVAMAISPIWALILYEDMNVNIFDFKQRNFELFALASTRNLVEFFSRHDVFLATMTGMVAIKCMPFVDVFAYLVPVMCEMLADQSEWRKEFAVVTEGETMREVAESEFRW